MKSLEHFVRYSAGNNRQQASGLGLPHDSQLIRWVSNLQGNKQMLNMFHLPRETENRINFLLRLPISSKQCLIKIYHVTSLGTKLFPECGPPAETIRLSCLTVLDAIPWSITYLTSEYFLYCTILKKAWHPLNLIAISHYSPKDSSSLSTLHKPNIRVLNVKMTCLHFLLDMSPRMSIVLSHPCIKHILGIIKEH